jgi:Glycosyltransferase family 87
VASTSRVLSTVFLVAVLAIVAISSGKQLRRANTRGDVEVYIHAARLVLAGQDLYAVPEPRGQQPYLYLPLFAFVAIPLTLVPFQIAVVLWSVLTVALAWWIVVAFFGAMTGRPFSSLAVRARWIVGFFSILLTLRALLYHLDLGQANVAVMAIAVLGLTWLAAGRSFAAGAAIGLATVLKVIVLPLWIPFIAQRRGRVAAGLACGALAGLLLPALCFGFDRNLSYLSYWLTDVILPVNDLRSTRHWPLNMNYSLAAQLYRFFGGVVAFEHDGHFYSVTIVRLSDPVLHLAGRIAPAATALVIALYAWVHRRRQPLVGLWGSVALSFCLAPLFSLLSHKHYWVMLLPAHVYVVYLWHVQRLRDRWFRGLVVASFAVAMLSTTLFSGLGALMSNLGGLTWGAMLLAAGIFRAASRVREFDEPSGRHVSGDG